jgi:hypothetical protein
MPVACPLITQLQPSRFAAANDAMCHNRTHAAQQTAALFDHLVGAGKQYWRDTDIQSTSRFYIDHQLEFCRLLDGEVGRFCAFDDLVDVGCGALEDLIIETRLGPRR